MSGLVRSFRGGFIACADQLGLGRGEAQVLWLLSTEAARRPGPWARRLGVDPANASTLLTKLERRVWSSVSRLPRTVASAWPI